MFQIDPRTLLLALVLVHMMATGCLIFVWTFQKTYRGFGEWVGAMAGLAAGTLLLAARDLVPDLLSIIGGNSILFLAYTLQLQAGRVFLNRGRLSAPWWWAPLPMAVVFVLLTFVWPDLQARILIGGIYATVLELTLAWELFQYPAPTVSQAARFTGSFILVSAAVTFSRGISGLFGSPSATYLDSENLLVLNGLVGVTLGLAIPFGILMMNHQRLEGDLATSKDELARSRDELRMLRGFIPICASCNKIRDDDGFWTQLEVFIRDHSEAEFSHGICPECAERLYPELDPESIAHPAEPPPDTPRKK